VTVNRLPNRLAAVTRRGRKRSGSGGTPGSPRAAGGQRRRAVRASMAVVAVSLLANGAVPSARALTLPLGDADVANVAFDRSPAGYKFGSRAILGAAGTTVSIRFYARGGPARQPFVPFVYATDAAGRPTARLAAGPATAVPAGRAPGWISAPLPGVRLAPGTYVLGLLALPPDTAGAGAEIAYSSLAGASFWNENDESSPTATWGDLRPDDVRWKVVVDLEPELPQTTTTTTTTTTTPPTTGPGPSTTLPPGSGGCAPFPAFPDKQCTGVAAGSSLSPYQGGVVTTRGTVIADVVINSRVTVAADDVTFRNCLIDSADAIAIAVTPGFRGLTIENCTFKAGSMIGPGAGLTIRRVLVDPDPGRYRPDGLVVGFTQVGGSGQDILIEDSYISPQWADAGDHPDAIQFWGFGTVANVTIRHNLIDSTNANPAGQAGGAGVFMADGSYENVVVEENLFRSSQSGYFHLRLASDRPTAGHVVRSNRFDRSRTPADLFRMTPATWDDNRYLDGQLVPMPAVRG